MRSIIYPYTYYLSPEGVQGVPADVRTLVLLLHPYAPWDAPVDAFYITSNHAYKQTASIGVPLPHVRLKPICNRLPMFLQGRNTLHYHAEIGSRFCMTLCGLKEAISPIEYKDDPAATSPCSGCSRCINACPTGAISHTNFDREKCLRQYMLCGKPVPENMRDAMGERLLGCDICQRVCPMNAKIPAIEAPENIRVLFDVHALLSGMTRMEDIAEQVGWNYAQNNRWLAQAAIVAGNSADTRYLPALAVLIRHSSPVVAQHAAWAENKLSRLESVEHL